MVARLSQARNHQRSRVSLHQMDERLTWISSNFPAGAPNFCTFSSKRTKLMENES